MERDSAEVYGWTPTRDVNTLLDDNPALAADRVRGVWGDKTTLYVMPHLKPEVFAYTRATGARDTSLDIATNQGLRLNQYGFKGGIWSNGTTMWVLNYRYGEYEVDEYGSDISSSGILYAFTLKDGIYDADKGIPLHLDTYRAARGVWSDGTTVWVADWSAAKLFAYALVGGARKEGKDITLHLDNAAAQGIWSDGATIWVADWEDNKFYAYKMTAGTGFGDRDRYKEFDLAPDNMYPRDVWSDGETLYVPDAYGPAGQKLYSYYIAQPPNSRATGRPSITGIAVVDETLTADLSGISDANGLTRATYTYQWVSVDGGRDTDIPGATGSTYKVKQTDLRKRLKVKVSLIDNNRYQEGPPVSQAVGPVEGVIPPTIKFFSKNGTYQDAISVTWQSVRGAAEYKLEMQKQGDDDWTRITRGDFDRLPSSSDNRFLTGIAKDLECGATYDFRISFRGDGITFARQFGPYAETTVALTERSSVPHTDCPKPERPTNLRVNGEPQCATLNWTPPTGNDYTGVRIRRLTIPPSTAGEQDWEVVHERLNDSRTSYQDCKTTTSGPSGYGNWGKEYSYSVYYIKQEIKDNGERVTVESPRASSGLDLYGPTHPPGSPRNVRLTQNNQSRRTLAWEAPPHYGLILEQVLERRRGSLTDPWLTGYMVERRQYTVRPGAKNPDNYSVQFPEYEDVTLWSTTLTVGQNADDSRRGFLVPGGMNVPFGAVSTPGFSYASGTTTVEQLSVEQDQMAKLIFELTPGRFDSTTDKWTLVIDDTPFPLKDSTFIAISTKHWDNSGISWDVGQTVSVQLIERRTLDWEVMRPASDNNTSRSFTDDENAGAKTYVYRVRAVNAAGDSSGYWADDWLWMAEEPKP